MEAKRAHRRSLSARAAQEWRLKGSRAKRAYLLRVRQALEAEGFRATPFQWRHKGHAYGLIRDLGEKQIHVRVYEDGIVDAEIEVHKRYVSHLWSARPSAHQEVLEVFRRHGIPTRFVNQEYLPQVGAGRTTFPKSRVKVAHAIGGLAGAVGLLTMRLVLKRLKGRAP